MKHPPSPIRALGDGAPADRERQVFPVDASPKADPAGAPITAVAGHLGDMRTYAHWLRDERRLPAALLDQMFAIRNT